MTNKTTSTESVAGSPTATFFPATGILQVNNFGFGKGRKDAEYPELIRRSLGANLDSITIVVKREPQTAAGKAKKRAKKRGDGNHSLIT